MSKALPPLIPPFRFAIVEAGLFRGSYPKERNLRFLKRLRLKTILSLTPDPPATFIYEFCDRESIRMIHMRVDKVKEDSIPLTHSSAIQALQYIIDSENLPLYIYCLDGADITGLIISCLRRLQMWSIPSSTVELVRNLKSSTLPPEHREFVLGFTSPLELPIPYSIPQWLWGGEMRVGKKHPVVNVRWTNPEILAKEEEEERRQEREKVELKRRENADLKADLKMDLLATRDIISRKHSPKFTESKLQTTFPKAPTDIGVAISAPEENNTETHNGEYASKDVSVTLEALALEVWE